MPQKLTEEELQELSDKKGVNRWLVESYLRGLNLDLDWTKSEANLVKDASRGGWNRETVQAIREGLNFAYRNVLFFKPIALISTGDRSSQSIIKEVERVLLEKGRKAATAEFLSKAPDCSDYQSLVVLCSKYVELV